MTGAMGTSCQENWRGEVTRRRSRKLGSHFPYYISEKMTPQTDIDAQKNFKKNARERPRPMQLRVSQRVVTRWRLR